MNCFSIRSESESTSFHWILRFLLNVSNFDSMISGFLKNFNQIQMYCFFWIYFQFKLSFLLSFIYFLFFQIEIPNSMFHLLFIILFLVHLDPYTIIIMRDSNNFHYQNWCCSKEVFVSHVNMFQAWNSFHSCWKFCFTQQFEIHI